MKISPRRTGEEGLKDRVELLEKQNAQLKKLNRLLQARLKESTVELIQAKSHRQTAYYLTILIKYSPHAIVGVNQTGRVISWNEAAREVTGYQEEEILGAPIRQLFPNEEAARQLFAEVERLGSVRGQEITINRKDGQEITISLSVSLLGEGEDGAAWWVLIFRDLTEIKEIRARLLETEKLSAMAKIAGAVAHEIKNPLNSLFLNFDLLEDEVHGIPDLPASSIQRIEHLLQVVREEIDRVDDIIKEYLSLAKVSSLKLKRFEINGWLASTIEELRLGLPMEKVEVEADYGPQIPAIYLDENQFRRVLLNLFKNSLEAMPQGGRLKVLTRVEADHLKIRFRDNGIGIPMAEQGQVFAPFFSLKEHGTGLGLYLVREIILAHRGRVELTSREGEGTVVTLTLPLNLKEA